MEAFIQHLRSAREAKKLALTDIADATLINLRFLEEIERGNFSFLPQTYVRAFLREYALSVGLDPDETLHAYDAATGPRIEAAPGGPSADAPEAPQPPAPPPARLPAEGPSINPTLARVAVVTILVLAAVVIAWNLLKPDAMPSVAERPFDEVRQEHERTVDSAARTAAAPVVERRDSLTLVAVASDSAWMQLMIDDGPGRNVLLKPGGRRTWRAARRFGITLGNAGAVEFTLNSRSLGKLGKAGVVMRNIELTHATLGTP